MRRRDFIVLTGGATIAWPLAARAQQAAKVPVVGILTPAAVETSPTIEAFRRAMRDLGYVEGQTVRIDLRVAKGDFNALPRLAAELASIPVDGSHGFARPCHQAAPSTRRHLRARRTAMLAIEPACWPPAQKPRYPGLLPAS
jgi:hypothetical protein